MQRRHADQPTVTLCRFDFPGEWATLLADLTAAASWENMATSVTGKERALFTLKNTLCALRGKRIVVETPRSSISMSPQGVPSMLPKSWSFGAFQILWPGWTLSPGELHPTVHGARSQRTSAAGLCWS